MASPLTTKRNKYHSNIKDSTVFTPKGVADFIFDILNDSDFFAPETYLNQKPIIFDPAVGSGRLLCPFRFYYDDNFILLGMDIEDHSKELRLDNFFLKSFLKYTHKDIAFKPDLIILNPPFNTDKRNKDWLKKNKLGKALLPEVFIDKINSLWGKVPTIMISPMGYRLNQRIKSKRWKKMSKSEFEITSIASLPLDIFPNVEFHNEILFFNMPSLKGHYWFSEKYLD